MSDAPLVSVVTPVYNGEEFLPQCIESVLAQTYRNWDFTLVNNCSTDGTLRICEKYAALDPRIRVITNSSFLKIIENHNRAVSCLSPQAKYCKVLFADDWLFPNCLQELVANAEQNPSVGLVSSYALAGDRVLWTGLPFPSHVVKGREICRRKLAGGIDVFGTPSAQLIRAELVRKRGKLYNESNLHADTEACLNVLQESDFGFVHQVLSYSRPRPNSNDTFARSFDSHILGMLAIFLRYGPTYLDQDEYRHYLRKRLKEYHRVLARNVLRCRSAEFWRYHSETLSACGAKIDWLQLAASLPHEVIAMLRHPIRSLMDLMRWWSEAFKRAVHGQPKSPRLESAQPRGGPKQQIQPKKEPA
jgi:glycosyltransferase involved in cell wall biosynthesis